MTACANLPERICDSAMATCGSERNSADPSASATGYAPVPGSRLWCPRCREEQLLAERAQVAGEVDGLDRHRHRRRLGQGEGVAASTGRRAFWTTRAKSRRASLFWLDIAARRRGAGRGPARRSRASPSPARGDARRRHRLRPAPDRAVDGAEARPSGYGRRRAHVVEHALVEGDEPPVDAPSPSAASTIRRAGREARSSHDRATRACFATLAETKMPRRADSLVQHDQTIALAADADPSTSA